jgi:phage baseplate assembly protein W
MTQIAFPYHIDGRGRTADTDLNTHISDLIQQTLFVTPGERVNNPTFGSGLFGMTFEPTGGAVAAAAQLAVQAALQQWLGDLIHVQAVVVSGNDSTLQVTVRYMTVQTRQQQVVQFNSGV